MVNTVLNIYARYGTESVPCQCSADVGTEYRADISFIDNSYLSTASSLQSKQNTSKIPGSSQLSRKPHSCLQFSSRYTSYVLKEKMVCACRFFLLARKRAHPSTAPFSLQNVASCDNVSRDIMALVNVLFRTSRAQRTLDTADLSPVIISAIVHTYRYYNYGPIWMDTMMSL